MKHFMVVNLHEYVTDFRYFLRTNHIFQNKTFYITEDLSLLKNEKHFLLIEYIKCIHIQNGVQLII